MARLNFTFHGAGFYTISTSDSLQNFKSTQCFDVLYTKEPSTLLQRMGLISFCTLLPISLVLEYQGIVHGRLASGFGNRRSAFALGTNCYYYFTCRKEILYSGLTPVPVA
mmetsp:Transcript_6261/g.22916  ORF Transcript_6261/g.22916 Transcript_6261/m.22916 type:complete len:110 (-) Transcript_6261:2231-2560(-)